MIFGNIKRHFSRVTLLPGHGIGPEISNSVQEIFKAANLNIQWDIHEVYMTPQNERGDLIKEETLESIKNNKFALKGPLATPIGKGYRSLNITLRQALKLYANVRPCKTIPGVDTRYDNVDVVTIRENTEGEYSGLEHMVTKGVAENLKIITKNASMNICEFAFKYAQENNRKSVTVAHKAGIMKKGDGLFLDCCLEVAQKYPDIQLHQTQIDTICYNLAKNPSEIDVMVMPNLYGDIVSDLCAGLIGGLGLTPSGNIGLECCLYEAVHGTGPDIAGQNKANPTALLLSGVMMLNQMGYNQEADKIKKAIFETLKEGKYTTGDLGGKGSTTDFTKRVIEFL